MMQEKSDVRIHLSDGDVQAANKLIKEVRRDPIENSLHRMNPSKLPMGLLVGLSIIVGMLVLILLF